MTTQKKSWKQHKDPETDVEIQRECELKLLGLKCHLSHCVLSSVKTEENERACFFFLLQ